MKKILLACAGGFSTSMLVERMKEAARAQNIEVLIDAVAESDIDAQAPFDIIMLGPQMGHAEAELAEAYPQIPVATIDMADYGMMNGEKVLATAFELMEKGVK
ncbi:PTS sugar transporter subunit IIB [Paenibacillus macerans]|uniref:PTS sugar transporter subunit IIB n=1 Tax=Paenibacillus macerans TaxID=44252 RepID=UPI002E21E0E3|nr:PTS sugar transporter subunit IIB [Paenibacillus macerans]